MNSNTLRHIDDYLASEPHRISFAQIGPAKVLLPSPPKFLFGNVPSFLNHALFGDFDVPAVGCYLVRQGRVTTDGIVLRGDVAFWSYGLNLPDYHVTAILAPSGLNRAALPVRYMPGQAAVICGPGYGVYGHWLADFLPRVFLLNGAGYDLADVRFVIPDDVPGFALELLTLAGIKRDRIIFHAHHREQIIFDELIVPTIMRGRSRLHPLFREATEFWAEKAQIPSALEGSIERIFVSRMGLQSGRVLTNREGVEGIARDHGFTVLRPETLPIIEQIALFKGAALVVGEYGSGLHSTIFGRPSLGILALRGTSIAPGFLQSDLASAFGQGLGYVLGNSAPELVDYEFTIDENDFRLGLKCLGIL